MKQRIILAFGLAVAASALVGTSALLAGCGNQGGKSAGIPIEPKWKGLPYHIAFDDKAKPGPDFAIPPIKYTANPDAIENRGLLVLRFDIPGAKTDDQPMHRMIGAPVDIRGTEGTLPADYMDRASKGLAEYLGAYCANGKVHLSVALARSSLNPQGTDADIDGKRLSDWLPTDLVFKNKKPDAKCKK